MSQSETLIRFKRLLKEIKDFEKRVDELINKKIERMYEIAQDDPEIQDINEELDDIKHILKGLLKELQDK